MVLPDLSITISQRRWACVLDPALVLSRFGVPLIQRLGDVMDLWIVRELWHILDNSRYFLKQPEALFAESDAGRSPWIDRPDDAETTTAMKAWERIRMTSDLRGLRLCWLNDCLADSLTPEGQTADLLPQFESLACALDRHLIGTGPMACAARDTMALATALGTAFVLTQHVQDSATRESPPQICRLFAESVPSLKVDADNPIAAIERNHLRHLLVHAGLTNLLFNGLHLSVIHVAAPAVITPGCMSPGGDREDDIEVSIAEAEPTRDPWHRARTFWYLL